MTKEDIKKTENQETPPQAKESLESKPLTEKQVEELTQKLEAQVIDKTEAILNKKPSKEVLDSLNGSEEELKEQTKEIEKQIKEVPEGFKQKMNELFSKIKEVFSKKEELSLEIEEMGENNNTESEKTKMNRRNFLKKLGLGFAGVVAFGPKAFAEIPEEKNKNSIINKIERSPNRKLFIFAETAKEAVPRYSYDFSYENIMKDYNPETGTWGVDRRGTGPNMTRSEFWSEKNLRKVDELETSDIPIELKNIIKEARNKALEATKDYKGKEMVFVENSSRYNHVMFSDSGYLAYNNEIELPENLKELQNQLKNKFEELINLDVISFRENYSNDELSEKYNKLDEEIKQIYDQIIKEDPELISQKIDFSEYTYGDKVWPDFLKKIKDKNDEAQSGLWAIDQGLKYDPMLYNNSDFSSRFNTHPSNFSEDVSANKYDSFLIEAENLKKIYDKLGYKTEILPVYLNRDKIIEILKKVTSKDDVALFGHSADIIGGLNLNWWNDEISKVNPDKLLFGTCNGDSKVDYLKDVKNIYHTKGRSWWGVNPRATNIPDAMFGRENDKIIKTKKGENWNITNPREETSSLEN